MRPNVMASLAWGVQLDSLEREQSQNRWWVAYSTTKKACEDDANSSNCSDPSYGSALQSVHITPVFAGFQHARGKCRRSVDHIYDKTLHLLKILKLSSVRLLSFEITLQAASDIRRKGILATERFFLISSFIANLNFAALANYTKCCSWGWRCLRVAQWKLLASRL